MTMKEWMQAQGLSYRRLAADMRQSPSGLCKKINGRTKWQEDDLRWLNDHYGLSSDFVLGLPIDKHSSKRVEVA